MPSPQEEQHRLPRRLPVVISDGKEYFVDERLHEYRAVENPHDRIDMDEMIVLVEMQRGDAQHPTR